MPDPWTSYDREAAELAAQYESLAFETVHRELLGCLPDSPATVLDVGAGSGRDAAWFAERGHPVVALEPAEGMRAEARARHPHPAILWLPDALPDLAQVGRSGLAFDFILLAAVWMHVAPADRPRAFRKLVGLLAPGGAIAFSLRHGPIPAGRIMHPVSAEELEGLAAAHALAPVLRARTEDSLGRPEVSWTTLVFRLPDDGSGALPLLRSIILRDRKSSTYKLGLLRVLCRIAEDHPGVAREGPQGCMELPFGLVALNWLRAYLPLHRKGLPQHPQVARGFAGTLDRLAGLDPQQLRPGMSFHGDAANALGTALREAARTIATMPATYITSPRDGARIFQILPAEHAAGRGRAQPLVLDEAAFWSIGAFTVPGHLWRSFLRLAPWIEPLLRQEWAAYMGSLRGSAEPRELWQALEWVNPERDTREVRAIADRLEAAGQRIYCVWSGRALAASDLDIDHCFPMAAWPCQDLWNLMPAKATLNSAKSDRLVSLERLEASRERILDWWDRAYRGAPEGEVGARFEREARMTLGITAAREDGLEPVFSAVALKRMSLSQMHPMESW